MGKQGFKKASPSNNFYRSNLGNTTKPAFIKPNPLEVLKEQRKLPTPRRPARELAPKKRDQKNKRSRKPSPNKQKVPGLRPEPRVERKLPTDTSKSNETNRFTPPSLQGKPKVTPKPANSQNVNFSLTDKYKLSTQPTVPPIIRIVPQTRDSDFSHTANYGSDSQYELHEVPVAKTMPPKLPPAAFKSAAKIGLLFDTSTTSRGEVRTDLNSNMKLRVLMGIHLDKYNIHPPEAEAAQKAQNELIHLKLGVKGARFKLTPLGHFIGETLEHLGNATLHSIKLDETDVRTQALLEQGLVKRGHVEIDVSKEHLFKTPHLMQLLREENVNLTDHPARVQLKLPRLVLTENGTKLHALLSIFSLRNRSGTVTPPPIDSDSNRVVERRGIATLSNSLANNLEKNSEFRRQWGVSTAQLPVVVDDLRRIARNEVPPKYERPRRETMQLPAIPFQAARREHVAIWRRVANALKAGFAEFKRK